MDSSIYLRDNKLSERQRKVSHVVNFYDGLALTSRLEDNGFEVLRSRYILKPPTWNVLTKIGTGVRWGGYSWKALSLTAYPLCWLSEKLLQKKESEYTLMQEARTLGKGKY